MPKRTREDFLSIQKLSATIDVLAPHATPWQVASRCATAMVQALDAHAVVIHRYDASRRELRSIGVHGSNAGEVLGTTTSVDDDFLASVVLTNKKALMLPLDGNLPRFMPERHRVLGSTRSLAVYPVMRAGECTGLIEIVGVADERQQSVKDACELVAQRLLIAFDSAVERETFESEKPTAAAKLPPTSGTRRTRTSLASSAATLDEDERRFVMRCSEPADRAAHPTPPTFPKRAPTLLSRAIG